MKLDIIVNRRHIIGGVPANPKQCPIARAIREQYDVEDVRVFGSFVYLGNYKYDGNDYKGSLPEEVGLFILKFDLGREVQPINFSIEFSKIGGYK